MRLGRWMGTAVIGMAMAAALTACTPTQDAPSAEGTTIAAQEGVVPGGMETQAAVDGAAEKESMIVTDDPGYAVVVYTVNKEKSGLMQNMDGIDGEELDPQKVVDLMASYKLVPEGTKVTKFDEDNAGNLTVDITGIAGKDELTLAAIGNTLNENYETKSVTLLVNGAQVGEPMTYIKNYKKMK